MANFIDSLRFRAYNSGVSGILKYLNRAAALENLFTVLCLIFLPALLLHDEDKAIYVAASGKEEL